VTFLTEAPGGAKKFIGGSGVVTSAGTIEIDFPQPASGMMWTGSVAVTNGPTTALWTLNINSIPIDILSGAQTAAGVQVEQADVLTITGSNLLVAGAGTTINATFTCIESPASTTPLIVPGQDTLFPSTPNGVFIGLIQATAADSPQVAEFPCPLGTTYILAYAVGTVSPPSTTFNYALVIGNAAGPVSGATFSGGPLIGLQRTFQVAIPSAVNQQVTVQWTVSGSAAQGIVYFYAFSSPQFDNNTSKQPTFTTPVGDPQPTTVHTATATSVPNNTTTTILSAVLFATQIWEIIGIICVCHALTTAATALDVKGLTSGTLLLEGALLNAAAVGTTFQFNLNAPFYNTEGLTLNQLSGVAIECIVTARALTKGGST
jgi:hypothetical protein